MSESVRRPSIDSLDSLDCLPSDESRVSLAKEQTESEPLADNASGTTSTPDEDHTIQDRTSPTARRDSSEAIPIEKNVFYNQETLKYMRIIDKYKRLDVAEIELPRVSPSIASVLGSSLISSACHCWCSKFGEVQLAGKLDRAACTHNQGNGDEIPH